MRYSKEYFKIYGHPRGMLGKKMSVKTKEKMRKSSLGNTHGFQRGKMKEEHRLKIVASLIGNTRTLGYKHTQERKDKISKDMSGKNHWNWQGGLSEENRTLRHTREWKNWRTSVFARDNFTCRDCGMARVYIEPHHILPIRSDRSKLFDTNNGITLCRPCHQKTIWKESDFAEKYSALIMA